MPPHVAGGTLNAPGWTTLALHLDHAWNFTLRVNKTLDTNLTGYGIFLSNNPGPMTPPSRYVWGSLSYAAQPYYYSSNLTPAVTIQHAPSGSDMGTETEQITVTFFRPLDGDYTATLVFAGDVQGWSWELGAAQAVLNGTRTGDGAFIFNQYDFRGTLATGAIIGIEAADLDVDAHVHVHATNHLVGFFSAGNFEDARAQTPSGTQTCSCSFPDLAGPFAYGPGDYDFRINGAELNEGTYLLGASVEAPN